MVEVEVGRLRALEEHPLADVQRLVHEVHGVVDHRREARDHRARYRVPISFASIGSRL